MNVLELVGLTVGYRTHRRVRTVLTGLDPTLDAGGLGRLVGPNGAGKSTLLRTISGLQPPLAGSVKLLGQEISRMKRDEVARQVAVVLTDRVDPGRLTVFDVPTPAGLGALGPRTAPRSCLPWTMSAWVSWQARCCGSCPTGSGSE